MRRLSKKSRLISSSTPHDAGLLLLRLGVGLPMLLNHGLPYLSHFDLEAARFLPMFGLDAGTTLVLAIMAELGGAFLMVVGLFTRLAALVVAVTMMVAFVMVHGASFGGEQSGELAFLYIVGASALIIMGSGRFSWDQMRS
jgi:putative oxidoreductase